MLPHPTPTPPPATAQTAPVTAPGLEGFHLEKISPAVTDHPGCLTAVKVTQWSNA